MTFPLARPARARTATVLAVAGLAYIGYLFVLACIVLNHGIPDDVDYYLGHVPLESDVLGVSILWGTIPLVLIFVAIIVFARTSRAPAQNRLAYTLLVVGFPLAVVAYFVWYQSGW